MVQIPNGTDLASGTWGESTEPLIQFLAIANSDQGLFTQIVQAN